MWTAPSKQHRLIQPVYSGPDGEGDPSARPVELLTRQERDRRRQDRHRPRGQRRLHPEFIYKTPVVVFTRNNGILINMQNGHNNC